MKVCRICKQEKLLSCFSKNRNNKDGLKSECKDCISAERAAKKLQMSIDERNSQREKQTQIMRNWRRNNKTRDDFNRLSYGRKTQYKAQREWQKQNRDRVNSKRRERYNNDPFYKMTCDIRSLVSHAWDNHDYSKSKSTQAIIGCSFEELWQHLIATCFSKYGEYWTIEKYHIDHIVPLSTATTEEDLIRLNHYSNLQLLLEKDNLSKGSKLFYCPIR